MNTDKTDICARNARELAALETMPKVRVVGITGGIASGKTVATDALRRAGYYIVDADEISRDLTRHGSQAEKDLCEMFPFAAVGDSLDRRALRRAVAADPKIKRRLEDYTHPRIISQIKTELSRSDKAVLSAPLLFETALGGLCDVVVCITCPTPVKIDRLVARDGISPADAAAIIDAQIPDLYRATLADFCVPSDNDRQRFEQETVALFDRIFGA